MGQGRVVQRAVLVGDPFGGTPELAHQFLGQRPDVGRGGHAERDALAQPGQVFRPAGERHRRVQGERPGAARDGRFQDTQSVRSRGVRDDVGRSEAGDDGGERVVGYRDDRDVVRAAGDDRVARVGEGGGEYRPDPAGADDAHGTAARRCAHLSLIQSSMVGYRSGSSMDALAGGRTGPVATFT